jgi:hypothetical protein
MTTRHQLGSDLLSAGGLTVTPGATEISRKTRLASAAMVKDVIAVKRTWKFSYTDLPGLDSNVRDAGPGRDTLWSLYLNGGTQTLVLPAESGIGEAVEVMFGEGYSEKRTSVTPFWRWDVEFTLEEV